MNYWPMV